MMDVLISLCYLVFTIFVVYPPSELVAAGFTIESLFDNLLGSENMNFIDYHMKRMSLSVVIHSMLPMGYVFCLWCGGVWSEWIMPLTAFTTMITTVMCYKLVRWWEHNSLKHPVSKVLQPYATEGSDWRVVAASINDEYKNIDKVSIQLTATTKFVATMNWLIKVSQYHFHAIKQENCTLMVTASQLMTVGQDELQFLEIRVSPIREDVDGFNFRLSTNSFRDLQSRLSRPILVPENISLLPLLMERFIKAFKEQVQENPIFFVDEELETCIGCMMVKADVKLNKRCDGLNEGQPLTNCQPCNCRALWCCGCMARWWAARTRAPTDAWLAPGASCTCPLCRSVFCIRDVCTAVRRPPLHP